MKHNFCSFNLYNCELEKTWAQFHQRSTYRFYARRSRKRKDTYDLTVFFTLLGSTSVKSVRKTLMKLTPAGTYRSSTSCMDCLIGLIFTCKKHCLHLFWFFSICDHFGLRPINLKNNNNNRVFKVIICVIFEIHDHNKRRISLKLPFSFLTYN